MTTTAKKIGARLLLGEAHLAPGGANPTRAPETGAKSPEYRKLLIATDFSKESLLAARAALAMAPLAEVVLVHAYRLPDHGLMLDLSVPSHIIRSCLDKAREVARLRLDDFARALGDQVNAQRVSLYGRARSDIPEYAASIGADLVAVGRARRSLLRDLFWPGLAARLARMKLDVVHCTPVSCPRPKRNRLAAGLRWALLQRRIS